MRFESIEDFSDPKTNMENIRWNYEYLEACYDIAKEIQAKIEFNERYITEKGEEDAERYKDIIHRCRMQNLIYRDLIDKIEKLSSGKDDF